MTKIIPIVLAIALVIGARIALAESLDVPSMYVPSPRQILLKEATAYHIDPVIFLKVATCESGLNPKAKNFTDGKSLGILQFKNATFLHYAKLVGINDPDIWSVEQQAKVGAFMFSTKQAGQWECFHKVGGIMGKVLIRS